jgi:hypothetical protein
MRADKNSFRRSNSAYVPNSQPSFPTRVFQGRVVTTDLPTLGTNPKQSQSESKTKEDLATAKAQEDGPRGWGKLSTSTGRTVRDPRADNLKNAIEPPEAHLE